MTLFSRLRLLFWVIQPRAQVLKFNNFCFHFRIPNGRGEEYIRVVGGKSQRNGLPPHFPLCDAKESKKCAKSVYKKVLSLSFFLYNLHTKCQARLHCCNQTHVYKSRAVSFSMRHNLIFELVLGWRGSLEFKNFLHVL